MLERTCLGLGVLLLAGCLDIFGADDSSNDSDGGENGDGTFGGGNRGGRAGRGSGGRAGSMPSGGTAGSSAGDFSGGTNTGGASTGGASTGGASTGGASTGGTNTGGVSGGTGGDAPGGASGAATGGTMAGVGGGPPSGGSAGTLSGGTGGGAGAGPGTGGQGGSAGSCATEELLLNPSFDYGDIDWGFESLSWSSLVVTGSSVGVTPQSGTYLGRVGGYEAAEDVVYQFVEIPPSATNIVLSFYERISTTWAYDYAYDVMAVGVFDELTGDSLGSASFTNLDTHTGWVRHQVTVDPSAAGAYVIVAAFLIGYDYYESTTLFVDTMSLQARVCR